MQSEQRVRNWNRINVFEVFFDFIFIEIIVLEAFYKIKNFLFN